MVSRFDKNLNPADAAAAQFHARWRHVEREPTDKELKAWMEWLQTSPRHVKAAFAVEDVYERVGETEFMKNFDVDAWLARGRAAVIALPETEEHVPSRDIRFRQRWRPWTLSLAACFVVAMALPFVWQTLAQPKVYRTGIGEHLTFDLEDGSVLELNTRSSARVTFDKQTRTIDLEGEGLFTVARDPLRPFLVRTRSSTTRAVGTRFNVYEHDAGTTVTVVEGKVQVTPVGHTAAPSLPLDAGEEARVTAGQAVKSSRPDISHRIAWQTRSLAFEKARLADVAAEFNRYNKQQFEIDSKLAELRLTGNFDARYPKSLVLWLQNRADVRIRDGADTIIVELRP